MKLVASIMYMFPDIRVTVSVYVPSVNVPLSDSVSNAFIALYAPPSQSDITSTAPLSAT